MATGTIKQIKTDRGFGFIYRGKGERDVFFHRYDWKGPLEFGEQLKELPVQFDLETTDKGPRARNVKPQ